MQRFQVPQFITVEDKVIGRLTLKQALYLGLGAGLVVVAFLKLEGALFFVVTALSSALFSALAFLKISEQPFATILKNAIIYFLRPRVYVWKRSTPKELTPSKKERDEESETEEKPIFGHSRLTELAWTLDTKTRETPTRRRATQTR